MRTGRLGCHACPLVPVTVFMCPPSLSHHVDPQPVDRHLGQEGPALARPVLLRVRVQEVREDRRARPHRTCHNKAEGPRLSPGRRV